MQNLQPLNDRVLIRRLEEPEQRIGGIIVPDIAKCRAIKGEIVAVGRGKWHSGHWWFFKSRNRWEWQDGWLETPSVHVGQVVYFNSRWNDIGFDYQHPGVGWDEGLHVAQQADIFAIAN